MAQNNIEAYQGVVSDSQQANRVLRLDVTSLKDQKDSLLIKLSEEMKKNKIKPSKVNTIATQTQKVNVIDSKGVRGDIKVNVNSSTNKDTTYNDSIQYNSLTKVYYWINKDSVKVKLGLKNASNLFVYSKKEYVNKKSFIKRLFTLDFKRRTYYQYNITNTNDLLKTSDVRVIESIK